MSIPSRSHLVEAFAGFPARLEAAAIVGAASPALPGEWGAAETVRHLIAVEAEVHQARLAELATLDTPRWTWTEPGLAPGFDDASLEEILAAFAAARGATVATIRALDEAGWRRIGTHATFGDLDAEGLLRLAHDHDLEHLAAVRALGV
jgi:DinB superfamily